MGGGGACCFSLLIHSPSTCSVYRPLSADLVSLTRAAPSGGGGAGPQQGAQQDEPPGQRQRPDGGPIQVSGACDDSVDGGQSQARPQARPSSTGECSDGEGQAKSGAGAPGCCCFRRAGRRRMRRRRAQLAKNVSSKGTGRECAWRPCHELACPCHLPWPVVSLPWLLAEASNQPDTDPAPTVPCAGMSARMSVPTSPGPHAHSSSRTPE